MHLGVVPQERQHRVHRLRIGLAGGGRGDQGLQGPRQRAREEGLACLFGVFFVGGSWGLGRKMGRQSAGHSPSHI